MYFTGQCSCTDSNVHTLFLEEREFDKTQKIVVYLDKSAFSCLQYHHEFFYGANNVNLYAEVKIGAEFPKILEQFLCDPPQFLQELSMLYLYTDRWRWVVLTRMVTELRSSSGNLLYKVEEAAFRL